jgi:hypothetical protein
MLKKYWLILGILPLAGCVSQTERTDVVLHAPAIASPAIASPAGEPAAAADPLGLEAAMALVRQQPWCHRRTVVRHH